MKDAPTWEFEPIASHGMSEDQVRAKLEELNWNALQEFHERLLVLVEEEGFPPEAVNRSLQMVADLMHERLERALPQIMHNMALTAGALTIH